MLKERSYILAFFLFSFAALFLFVLIPVLSIPGNDLVFQLSIFRWQDYLLMLILAFLVGLNFSMNLYWQRKQKKLAGISKPTASGATVGISGAFAAIVGTATCASCLASLFAFFGLGMGSVAFVLQYQTFFLLGTITLMAISLDFTARKVLRICNLC